MGEARGDLWTKPEWAGFECRRNGLKRYLLLRDARTGHVRTIKQEITVSWTVTRFTVLSGLPFVNVCVLGL